MDTGGGQEKKIWGKKIQKQRGIERRLSVASPPEPNLADGVEEEDAITCPLCWKHDNSFKDKMGKEK